MKKRIKTMLSKGVIAFLYVQKPIRIVMIGLFFILLTLGAIKKYGGNYESSVDINKNILWKNMR